MITVVILTHNSAKTLPETLKSISWCEEILVIDDYSSDETVDIAGDYTARVIKRHLNDDFSAQRNFALEEAKGDWIFFVDSDEVVPEALQKEIRNTISRRGTDGEGSIGYFLKRADIFFGKKLKFGETAHMKLMRLGRKNAGKWVRQVHEYWDIKGTTQAFQTPLLHYAHSDVAQFIADINRYTTINAEYLHKRRVKSHLFSILTYPLAKFLQNYFLRLGILDGTRGFLMAMFMSFHSFLTRSKLYILNHTYIHKQ